MRLFIRTDPLQVRVQRGVLIAGCGEVRLGVVFEALFIESGFEVLEGESVVENVGWYAF